MAVLPDLPGLHLGAAVQLYPLKSPGLALNRSRRTTEVPGEERSSTAVRAAPFRDSVDNEQRRFKGKQSAVFSDAETVKIFRALKSLDIS